MFLHLDDQVLPILHFDVQGIVDAGQISRRKLGINNDPRNAGYRSNSHREFYLLHRQTRAPGGGIKNDLSERLVQSGLTRERADCIIKG
jgi:hypothetical protein